MCYGLLQPSKEFRPLMFCVLISAFPCFIIEFMEKAFENQELSSW